jgi:hypothetical protein
MKRSKTIRVQTTVGELVSVLCEETQNLFNFKRDERQLVVAYILNDLIRRPAYIRYRTRPKIGGRGKGQWNATE